MKVKVNYGSCTIFVQGTEMDCPLCGAHVASGENHHCESAPKKEIAVRRRGSKKKAESAE